MHILEADIITIISKVGDPSRGRPEGSLFNSSYTKVLGRALLLSLDCSTLLLIRTLWFWVLGKEVSSTIFKVYGMRRPGIEPRSPGPLANTLPTRPIRIIKDINVMSLIHRIHFLLNIFQMTFCACIHNKSLSYKWIESILKHLVLTGCFRKIGIISFSNLRYHLICKYLTLGR